MAIRIFVVWKMRIFLLPTYLLGEEVGQSIHGGRGEGQQEDERRGTFLVRWGIHGVQFREIILFGTVLH